MVNSKVETEAQMPLNGPEQARRRVRILSVDIHLISKDESSEGLSEDEGK